MKTLRNIAMIMLIFIGLNVIILGVTYNIQISPMDKNDTTEIEVVINKGDTISDIGRTLQEKELIRSATFFKIYVKIYKIEGLKATTYKLSKSMSMEEIVKTLQEGNSYNPNQIKITFKEGINIRNLASIIEDNTNNTKEEVLETLEDEEYLDELIDKYWFLSDEIKNENIYYSLEGYLFPDTYYFNDENVSVKEILNKMLDQMKTVLDPYKDIIIKKDMSVHEYLTLASIIEKEGKSRDFKNISSTFHNRLKIKMSLGSCATTYYGMKMEFNEVGIATNEMINDNNPYNTYILTTLPVGPISLPSKEAIEASINPNDTEYLYFLSDSEGTTYFFKTYNEHVNKKNELIKQNKWSR